MSFANYTNKDPKDILKEFSVSLESGLSEESAGQLLKKYGANEIKAREVTWATILVRQFKSPFLYLLLGAAIISLILKGVADGLMIFAFVAINAGLGFYQEYRSHQALELLKKFISAKSRVLREGRVESVDSTTLVAGDIVVLSPGDVVRADLRILQEDNFFVDESILTGESVPVEKTSTKIDKKETEIYKAGNIGFSGTTVVSGKAKGIIFATGMSTQVGEIALLASQTPSVSTFEKNIAKISRFVLRLVLITLVLVFFANFIVKGHAIGLFELVIFTIALAVSVIPEALPVVTTFSLSKGALKLAKNKVVVKRLSAIEDLGGIQVLCTDKTGTLTENHLKLSSINAKDQKDAVLLACLVTTSEEALEIIDPFDMALWESLSSEEKRQTSTYQKLQYLPFDPVRRRNSLIVKKEDQAILLSRGAPEEIIKICKKTKRSLSALTWAGKKGIQGQRVLALAKRQLAEKASYDFLQEEKDMEFVGLFAFEDPLKPTASKAINKAKVLGIKVKILTGDAPEVAGVVARQIGLIADAKEVITGEEFDGMPDSLKKKAVEKYSVFARVSPEQKYKIVRYLQDTYEVGFLGEGINDAPALKIANVALVVQSGAEIAKETADIVLLNKSLEVIVDAIEEGRRVFANTTKYIKTTLASNFGNFFAVASASLFIKFLPLLPLQILLLNLLSDFPMISIATDDVEDEELSHPKSYSIKDISRIAIILGVVSTLFDFVFFALFYKVSPATLQTNWFIGSVLTELALVFSIRTKKPFFRAKPASTPIILLTAFTITITLLIPFMKIGRTLFGFIKPTGYYLLLIVLIVFVYFLTSEATKLILYRFKNENS